MINNRAIFRSIIFIALFAVFNFYLWIITIGSYKFDFVNFGTPSYISYHHLTEALLQGKVNLPQEPHPELAKLTDPYNPDQNAPYRWHDATYYKGKYYLYFGPTPVYLFYFPYKLLTKHNLPCNFATFFFDFGAFIWATLLLLYLQKRYFSNTPKWMVITSIALLGLTNLGPIFLDPYGIGVSVYYVSCAAAMFFQLGAMFFLCRALEKPIPHFSMLAIGGLFLALSFGCRPNLILDSVILLIIFIKIIKDNLKSNLFFKLKVAFYLFVPFTFFLIVLGIYNYLRFENPFEFGFKYQLVYSRAHFLNLKSLFPNIYIYLFRSVMLDKDFPFFHMGGPEIPRFLRPPPFYNAEDISGMITGTPFLILPFLYWFFTFLSSKKLPPFEVFKFFEVKMLSLVAIINFTFIMMLANCNLRYSCDFRTLFILIACLSWFYFHSLIKKRSVRFFFSTTAITLATISILCGMAFGITGFRNVYKENKPEEFAKLASLFKPVSYIVPPVNNLINYPISYCGSFILFLPSVLINVAYTIATPFFEVIPNIVQNLTSEKLNILEVIYDDRRLTNAKRGQIWITDNDKTIFWFNGTFWIPVKDDDKKYKPFNNYGPFTLKVKFKPQPPKEPTREPLLTTGKSWDGDIAYVEYPAVDKVIFGFDVWGTSGIQSKPITVDPNKVYKLEISLGSLYPGIQLNGKVLGANKIILDDKLILTSYQGSHKTTEEEILIGENKIGGTYSISKFSGEILEVTRNGLKVK